ncbi:Crp/Fnr family transcriptional regulator [candidate division CSSED10-310 bacterium]|uniref:Crp/Fnr family transcriptional regulator n=1 Tax=candidate division CSSED10-310 bacterium TaxID=2855610 RepID=A0ABV6Z178_UNCC1
MFKTIKLQGKDIFENLRPEQVDMLSSHSEVIKKKAGEKVYERGTTSYYFFIVLSGKVVLTYPIKHNFNVIIEELGQGNMFGSCVCFNLDKYIVDAKCTKETELLKIEADALKKLMEEDTHLGFSLQTKISEIYFKRYIETIKVIKEVVLDLSD